MWFYIKLKSVILTYKKCFLFLTGRGILRGIAVLSKQDTIEVEGIVEEALPNARFKVKIEKNNKINIIDAHISGKLRMNYIRIIPGDKVTVEISPYDLKKGRIIWRFK
jgi:translation initiation factor IF-1